MTGDPGQRDPSSRRARRSRRRRALAAFALASLVALAAAEIVARILWGAPRRERLPMMEVRANARRGFELVPSSEHYTYLERVRVNALGLRGPELGEKAPGECRVLALGDSMIYGQGVAEEDTVTARLERELARGGGPRWRAVNGGIRAYDTLQEVALAEELAPVVVPDVVVLYWFANDLEEHDVAGMSARLARSGPIAFDLGEPARGGALLAWRAKQVLRASALVMRVHDAITASRHKPPAPQYVSNGLAKVGACFDRLAALARGGGFDVLVAAIPIRDAVEGPDPSEELVAAALALARERGFATLDLLPALRAHRAERGEPPVIPFDGHYDGGANGAIARATAEALREAFPQRFGAAR